MISVNYATFDRAAAADMVLELAVDEALDHIRAGRVGYAEFRLARATASADRILGASS